MCLKAPSYCVYTFAVCHVHPFYNYFRPPPPPPPSPTNIADIEGAGAEALLAEHAQKLIDDNPKIGGAVKNLMAMVLARHTTDPAAHLLFSDGGAFTPAAALSCGRALLQAINACVLPSPAEQAAAQPQGVGQSADARLTELIQYKCLYHLHQRAITSGGRVHALFGRRLFAWSGCWPRVRAACERDRPAAVPDDVFAYFLGEFERSLLLADVSPAGAGGANGERMQAGLGAAAGFGPASDAALVWAANFNDVLKKRQELRKAAALERIAVGEDDTS